MDIICHMHDIEMSNDQKQEYYARNAKKIPRECFKSTSRRTWTITRRDAQHETTTFQVGGKTDFYPYITIAVYLLADTVDKWNQSCITGSIMM